MKKLLQLLYIILILLLSTAYSQAQWRKVKGLFGNKGGVSDLSVTGNKIFTTTENGVFVSLDSGMTWQNSGITNNAYCLATQDSLIIACTSSVIYLSSDYGRTWKDVYNDAIRNVKIKNNKIYLNNGSSLTVSDDLGKTWSNLFSGLYSVECFDVKGDTILVGGNQMWDENPNFQGLYYFLIKEKKFIRTILCNENVEAITWSGSDIYIGCNRGLYISDNNGKTWNNNNYWDYSHIYSNAFTFHNQIIYYASYDNLIQSKDNGITWKSFDNKNFNNSNVNCIASIGKYLLAGTENEGIYISDDEGISWKTTQSNFSTITINLMGKTKDYLVGATSKSTYFSSNGGDNWFENPNGLDMSNESILFLSNDDSLTYICTDKYLSNKRIYYFDNKINKWIFKLQTPTNNVDDFAVSGGKVFITDKKQNNLQGALHVYRNDKWEQISVPFVVHYYSKLFVKLPYIYCYSDTINKTGIWISADEGKTWYVSDKNNGLYPSNILCLNSNNETVFAGNNDGLYISDNYGKSWRFVNVYGRIDNISIDGNKILLINSNVYYSEDRGKSFYYTKHPVINNFSFETLTQGLTNNNKIFVSMNYGGIWEYPLTAIHKSDYKITYNASTILCTGDSITLHVKTEKKSKYQWQKNYYDIDNATDSVYSAKSTGTYRVKITDSFSNIYYTNLVSISVTPAIRSVIVPTTTIMICAGDSLILTADSLTTLTETLQAKTLHFQWQKDEINIEGATNSLVVCKTEGFYRLLVNDTCKAVKSDPIEIYSDKPEVKIIAKGPTSFCPGDSVILYSSTIKINKNWYEDFETNNLKKFNWINTSDDYPLGSTDRKWAINKKNPFEGKNSLSVSIVNCFGCCGDSPTIDCRTYLSTTLDYPADDSLSFYFNIHTQDFSESLNFYINDSRLKYWYGDKAWNKVTFPVKAGTNTFKWLYYTDNPDNGVNGAWLDNINFREHSGCTYQWLKDGEKIKGATSYIYAAKTAGNFTVVANGNCGSFTSSPIVIKVHKPPDSTLVIIPDTANKCREGALTIETLQNKYNSYNWTIDDNKFVPTDSSGFRVYADKSGTYKVVIRDTVGCFSTAVRKVKIDDAIKAKLSSSGTVLLCADSSIVLKATSNNNATYQWKMNKIDIQGATNDNFVAAQSGWYYVEISNSQNCKEISNPVKLIEHPNQYKIKSSSPGFCKGSTYNINLYTSYSLYEDFETGNISNKDIKEYMQGSSNNWHVVNNGYNNSKYCIKSGNVTDGNNQIIINIYSSEDDSLIFYRKIKTNNKIKIDFSINNYYSNFRISEQWKENTGWQRMSYPVKSGLNYIYMIVSGVCYNDSLGLFIDNISLGSGQKISYQWQKDGLDIKDATNNNYSTLLAGVYTVKLNDTCGSITTVPFNLVNSTLKADVTAIDDTTNPCIKGAKIYTFAQVKGYKYLWYFKNSNNKDTLPVIYANTAGGYYVDVIDSLGCRVYTSVDNKGQSLSVILAPYYKAYVIPSNNYTICRNDSILLTSNPGDQFKYKWKKENVIIDGATNSTMQIKTAGLYKVILNWNGQCSDTSNTTKIITKDLIPQNTISANYNTLCTGDSIELTTNSGFIEEFKRGSLDYYNSRWKNDSVNPWLIYIPKLYYIIYSAITPILSQDEHSDLKLSVDLKYCDSISFIYSTTYNNYLHFFINDTLVAKLTSNDYYYISRKTARFHLNSVKNNFVWRYINSNYFPFENNYASIDNIKISNAGISYQWLFNGEIIKGATMADYFTKKPGAYTLECSNVCGKVNSDTINIIDDFQIKIIKSPPTNDNCKEGSIDLRTFSDLVVSYQWSKDDVEIPNSNISIFKAIESGIYQVKATSKTGCSSMSDTVKINSLPALPVIVIDTALKTCAGLTIIINAGGGFVSYKWSNGATSRTIELDSSGVGIGKKEFSVTVTNQYACEASYSGYVTFEDCSGITEHNNPLSFTIVPNPSDGNITLNFQFAKYNSHFDLNIFNCLGQKVYSTTLSNSHFDRSEKSISQFKIDLSSLSKGIYFIRLTNSENNLTKKIVKQ